MTDENSYGWKIQLALNHDVHTEAVQRFVDLLNSALLHAAEQVFSDVSDGRSTLTITSEADGEVEKTISLRKTFQITAIPREIDEIAYHSAQDAMAAMRTLRQSAARDKDTFLVVKEIDGRFRVARQVWASCEFDSHLEAEDAMQAFEDCAKFQIIPVVVVESLSTDP